jgi:outer membrane autotransporter protein
MAGLDDGKSANPSMNMNLAQPVDNDFWFKTLRNWGDGQGSSYYQGTTMAGGWDRAYGTSWRAGAFVSYGQMSFADNYSHNDVKDTRLGLYGGYSNGPHSGYIYLDYGWIKNDLTRQLAGLGYQAKADYKGRILELGGEYKYDLNAKNMKTWHVSPYANVQLSRLWQDGYSETGAGIAGILGQEVDSKANTYFAGGLGLEFKRYLANGSYGLRLGVKHAFTGSDPKFTYGYIGDDESSYELRGQQDKTHFLMSLGGEAEFAPGWTLAGDVALQKGSHDRDIMAAVTLRRMW